MTSGAPRTSAGIVLVFGESLNDSRSIEHLLVRANPALARRVVPVPRPVSLTRGAGVPATRDWADELRRVVRAYEAAGRPVRATLVHRDADGPDPSGSVETRMRGQLASVPAHPVVPVETIEAWWFLFPDAVESVRPQAWRGKMPRRARDVETIARPKDALRRATGRGRATPYVEADSVAIASAVRSSAAMPTGSSASYQRFVDLVRTVT